VSASTINHVQEPTKSQESPTSCTSKKSKGNEYILGSAKQYTTANGKRCTVDDATFATPFVHNPASAKYSKESTSLDFN